MKKIEELPAPHIEEGVALSDYTTLRIGGPARWFARVRSVEELRAAMQWAGDHSADIFILGGGSNLLVADRGFDGLVVQIAIEGIVAQAAADGQVLVTAGAGEEWDRFVEHCVSRNLAGVECLSGIPGLVGATPIQNVGAYGQDVSETIVAVEVLDRRDQSVRTLSGEDCRFGYRDSFFKTVEPGRYVVLGVTYALKEGGAPSIRYPELQRFVDELGTGKPSLLDVRNAVLAIRKRKGMVLDADDPDTRSAGSFFMNPLLSAEELERFTARVATVCPGQEPPRFPAADGKVKTSAAWLIERAGFSRGYRLGRAGISSKHTLAVINTGGASATEVVTLVRRIQQTVRDCFGVELHPEPNFVGFE